MLNLSPVTTFDGTHGCNISVYAGSKDKPLACSEGWELALSTCVVHWIESWHDIRVARRHASRHLPLCDKIYIRKRLTWLPYSHSSSTCVRPTTWMRILTWFNAGSWKTEVVQGTSLPFKGIHVLWVGMILIYLTSSCETVKKPRKVVGPFNAIIFHTA